jgi:formate hydrogenlyase subunit 6/NADH:ubiquinone oxidoreductase subunit I
MATHDRTYQLLQQRLDRNVTGAPGSPAFMQILRLLFTPEQAEIARRMPTDFVQVDVLARRLEVPVEQLDDMLSDMAQRGLVLDLERRGRRYVALAPVVIGFFEFTFMRARDDLPMAELAQLFEDYFFSDDRFARAVFSGETQIGRSLVREEALPAGDQDVPAPVEILDWERASHIVQSASAIAISLCPCRHHHLHLDQACERPLRTCMSLNLGARALVRSGIAESIDPAEAMDILAECKEAGLAQTGDNVQRGVSYICNCCGCCCGMMSALKTFNINNAIVSSNWISDIDLARCNGCGLCAKACPVDAIEVVIGERVEGRRARPRWAIRDADLCLGCGVCTAACKFDALHMIPREQRVFTPETTFDRMVAMAVERGKLADLILDNTDGLGYRALGRIVQVLEKTPSGKAARAVEPLRSVFLNTVVAGMKAGARAAAGPVS